MILTTNYTDTRGQTRFAGEQISMTGNEEFFILWKPWDGVCMTHGHQMAQRESSLGKTGHLIEYKPMS